MAPTSEERVAELLQPYVGGLVLPADFYPRLATYLDLLIRWNQRTNLTAVRDPEVLVQRQVGESLFAARFVEGSHSLLDFGSGAGFPGLPLQLALPGLRVTLAESQGKKASFLREAVRVLELQSVVWPGRVEDMGTERIFDVVAMRAVDDSGRMLPVATRRVNEGGCLLLYTASRAETPELEGWTAEAHAVPASAGRLVVSRRPVFHVEHLDQD